MFKLEIVHTENAAFEDNRGYEIARILRDAADKIETGTSEGALFDYNGNRVGAFELEDLDE
jgi:hypothetical protein